MVPRMQDSSLFCTSRPAIRVAVQRAHRHLITSLAAGVVLFESLRCWWILLLLCDEAGDVGHLRFMDVRKINLVANFVDEFAK